LRTKFSNIFLTLRLVPLLGKTKHDRYDVFNKKKWACNLKLLIEYPRDWVRNNLNLIMISFQPTENDAKGVFRKKNYLFS